MRIFYCIFRKEIYIICMGKLQTNRPEVAILVETSTSWGQQIVRGICDYAFRHGGWHFYLEPRGRYENILLPAGWRGDGVIGRITSQKVAEQLIAMKIAAVNVSCYEFGENQIPICTCDEEAIARLAAEHLLRKGLTKFAYFCDALRKHYTDRLGESFISYLAEKGYMCEIFKSPARLGQTKNWQSHREILGKMVEKSS